MFRKFVKSRGRLNDFNAIRIRMLFGKYGFKPRWAII